MDSYIVVEQSMSVVVKETCSDRLVHPRYKRLRRV